MSTIDMDTLLNFLMISSMHESQVRDGIKIDQLELKQCKMRIRKGGQAYRQRVVFPRIRVK